LTQAYAHLDYDAKLASAEKIARLLPGPLIHKGWEVVLSCPAVSLREPAIEPAVRSRANTKFQEPPKGGS